MREAEIYAHSQGLDGAPLARVGAFDHPRALSDDGDGHAGPAECAWRHDAIIAQRCLTILGKPVSGSGAQRAGTPGALKQPSRQTFSQALRLEHHFLDRDTSELIRRHFLERRLGTARGRSPRWRPGVHWDGWRVSTVTSGLPIQFAAELANQPDAQVVEFEGLLLRDLAAM